MDEKNQNDIQEQKRLLRQIERLLEDDIVDSNIRSYIFGTDDLDELIEDMLPQYKKRSLVSEHSR